MSRSKSKSIKAIGFLKENIFQKQRVGFFFIANMLLGILVVMLLYLKFQKEVLTFIFCVIIFFIRYQRKLMGIPMTFEPTIILSVILTGAYGLKYGIIAGTVPVLLSDIVSGAFRAGSFISLFCKILVLIPVYYLGHLNLFMVSMISYILFNEGVGTFLALQSGSELTKVITQLATSTIIRLVYFQFFLAPLCFIVGLKC